MSENMVFSEIRERLVRIETLIEGMSKVKDVAYEANNRSIQNEKNIVYINEKLKKIDKEINRQPNNTWIKIRDAFITWIVPIVSIAFAYGIYRLFIRYVGGG